MQINTAFKRATVSSWCKHTDNNFGGRNHKQVRAGKRFLRKRFNTFIQKEFWHEVEIDNQDISD